MKMTNLTMINVMNTLNAYSNKKLPQKISFAITKNLLVINKEYQAYEIELKKIFNEYADYFIMDENGNKTYNNQGIPLVTEEKSTEYQNDIYELLSIDVDVDLYLIDLDCFDYDDRFNNYDNLSAHEIATLQSIICKKEW